MERFHHYRNQELILFEEKGQYSKMKNIVVEPLSNQLDQKVDKDFYKFSEESVD